MSDAETIKQAKPPPKVRRRPASPGRAPKAADLNSIQTELSDAPAKIRPDSSGLDLSGLSRAPKLDRAGLLWNRLVRPTRSELTQNEGTRNKLLSRQVCGLFLAGRNQRDVAEFARDLAELPFEYARTNDGVRDRVVVGFGIDPKGPRGHSVRQYTEALKGLEIAARELEEAQQAEIPQDEHGYAAVEQLFADEGGIAKLAELGRNGKRGENDDESQHLIDLNRRRVEKHRTEAGLQELLEQERRGSGPIFFAAEADGGLVRLRPARLNTKTGQMHVASYARAEPQSEIHGTAFRLGRTCVAVTEEDGKRQCIRRRDCTLVYAPMGAAAGVIVEVEPLPQYRMDEAPGDAWVRPNERPRLEVNLQDPERRIAFNVGILSAEGNFTLKQAYAYLEVSTTFAVSGTRESKRAALSSAAAWARTSRDAPRDVNRALLGEGVAREGQHPRSFHSALDIASFAAHADERHDELIKVASRKPDEVAKKAKKKKGKVPSDTPPVPVVTLRFTEQHVEVHSRFSDRLVRHRDHVRPTRCAEVAVSVRDWALVSRELAALELVERSPEEPALELSVWPAGILRFIARTELATIRIWVPLLNPHTGERSYALMEGMRFEPWPNEVGYGAVEITGNFASPEEPVSSPEAVPAPGNRQDATGTESNPRDNHE